MRNNKKRFCFDLDGVICKTPGNNYKKAKPIIKAINKINELHSNGNYILIYTSRFMGRSKENSKKAHKRGYKMTLTQLKKWNVKFNHLKLGKPSYDYIIDDKSIFYSKNWVKKL